MDHRYIEEYNIADRYLLGKLPAEEGALFEEHFVDCPKCLDLLETTQNFRSGLQTVAAEEATQSSAYIQAGLLARLARLSRGRQAILLASAILFLVALPTAFFVMDARRIRSELEQARSAAAELQRHNGENQESARKLEEELRESERKLAEQRQQLESQLERERQADQMNRPGRLYLPALVLTLNRVRDSDTSQAPPVNEINIPRTSQMIILSPEVESDPEMKSYRATLTSAGNRLIWRKDNLVLDSGETLNLGFNARLFKAGDYLLTLEGLTTQGRYIPAGRYSFRVIKK
jgi:hypothetical protein